MNRTRRRAFLFLGLAALIGLPIALWRRELLGPTVRTLGPRLFPAIQFGSGRRPAHEVVLEKQRQGLRMLVAEADRGRLLSAASDQILVVLNQSLVQELVAALIPYEHVILKKYRVRVETASVSFEDGLALVRLDGRVSLAGVMEPEVFAELTVFGNLDLASQPAAAGVLRGQVHLIAVEARRVEVVMRTRDAEELVEELGRARLEEFAALAPSLEIPVAQEHQVTIPAVGPKGHLQIEAETLPVRLTLLDVAAFHGRLWICMTAAMASAKPATAWRPPAPESPAAEGEEPPPSVNDLRQAHAALHHRLDQALAKQPRLEEAERSNDDIVVAVGSGLAKQLLTEIARRYLDRVVLELDSIEVDKGGELGKDTFFGRLRGDWKARVTIQQVRGVLRAAAPQLDFREGNWLFASLPVSIEGGQGNGTVAFTWDSHALANLVCRDFAVTERISGRVLPERTPLTVRFLLTAAPGSLRADPRLDAAFQLRVELSRETWSRLRARLEEQNTLLKCGIGLHPDDVIGYLQGLVKEGFHVRVPSHLLRPIRLQTPVAQSLEVEQRRVQVTVSRSSLRTTPAALWYSAALEVAVPGRPPPRPSPGPHAF